MNSSGPGECAKGPPGSYRPFELVVEPRFPSGRASSVSQEASHGSGKNFEETKVWDNLTWSGAGGGGGSWKERSLSSCVYHHPGLQPD